MYLLVYLKWIFLTHKTIFLYFKFMSNPIIFYYVMQYFLLIIDYDYVFGLVMQDLLDDNNLNCFVSTLKRYGSITKRKLQ